MIMSLILSYDMKTKNWKEHHNTKTRPRGDSLGITVKNISDLERLDQ